MEKIYCAVCGEIMTDIIKHHQDYHELGELGDWHSSNSYAIIKIQQNNKGGEGE